MPARPSVRGAALLTPALIDVTDVKDRPDEEFFGPVLQIVRVKDFDDRDRRGEQHPLRPGGEPDRRQPRACTTSSGRNVRAGMINWNKPTNGAPSNAPFGGIGKSGNHRPSAFYAADYCAYPVTSSEAETAPRRDRRGPARPEYGQD